MDWTKVIKALEVSADWHRRQADEYRIRSGYHETVKREELLRDIAQMIASALSQGTK